MNLPWSDVSEFAAMGGYGLYVWGSFGMVAAALAWEWLTLRQRARRAVEDLEPLRAQEEAR